VLELEPQLELESESEGMWWGRVWLYNLPLLFRILLELGFFYYGLCFHTLHFLDVLLVGSEIDF
jgi:hypothetical protein